MKFSTASIGDSEQGYLSGQIIIAMPGIGDERFAKSVIFLCAHSADGAMGLIVNKPAPDVAFPELLKQLDILNSDDSILLPQEFDDVPVHVGGPVETGRGFVLHSSDYYASNATMPIDDQISLTATLDVLRAIAQGRGPTNAIMALGYAGWSPGQLETEIQANGWLHAQADFDLIFQTAPETKYERALQLLGIDPSFLATEAGHA